MLAACVAGGQTTWSLLMGIGRTFWISESV